MKISHYFNITALSTAFLMCQCTSPTLAKHGKLVHKKDGGVYYQPVQLEPELSRNVKKHLALHHAREMTCIYSGTLEKSKGAGLGLVDTSQRATGIVRVEKVYRLGGSPPLVPKDEAIGLVARTWINGISTDDVLTSGPLYAALCGGGSMLLKSNGETDFYSHGIMIEVLPIVSLKTSDSKQKYSIKPNASVLFDPISQTRLSCALFRTVHHANAGEVIFETLVSDEVPGRVLSTTNKTHIVMNLNLSLVSVTYR